ncbi:formin isoform X2 [Denticeps clupeoides]|uniref:formin isoform X2 n=1 Tax=Denticeps clupeoides TaxID=299321 RepID=UPI0010A4E4A9|nr:formin-1 isoform X2 [Denticeps clupeoides]
MQIRLKETTAAMEGTHSVLRLYKPIREQAWVSQCRTISGSHSSTHMDGCSTQSPSVICHSCTEAGSKESNMLEHQSSSKASEGPGLPWLGTLLMSYTDTNAQVAMGNQNCVRRSLSTEGRESPALPREGKRPNCPWSLDYALSHSQRAMRTKSRGRRLKNLWLMNTLHVEETLQKMARERRRVNAGLCSFRMEEEPTNHETDKTGTVKSDKNLVPPTERNVFKELDSLDVDAESESELSEYDNELYVTQKLADEDWNVAPYQHLLKNEATLTEESTLEDRTSASLGKFWFGKLFLEKTASRVAAEMKGSESIIQKFSADQTRQDLSTFFQSSWPDEGRNEDSLQTTEGHTTIPVEVPCTLGDEMTSNQCRSFFNYGLMDDDDWDLSGGFGSVCNDMKDMAWDFQSIENTFPDPKGSYVCPTSRNTQTKVSTSPSGAPVMVGRSPRSKSSLAVMPPLVPPCSSIGTSKCLLPLPRLEKAEVQRRHSVPGERASTHRVDETRCSAPVSTLYRNCSGECQKVAKSSIMLTSPTDSSFPSQDDIWQLDLDETLFSYRSGRQTSRLNHSDILRITPPEHDILSDAPFSPDLIFPCDVSSPGDGEERTPGRLQAIWPPPKPKDHEEKVGLKYTEAEHQTALLYLKRECKEEVEQLNAKFELKLFQLRGEHAETVSELERALADLQRDTKEASRGSLKDASVSTEDDASPKTFRTVCIQTDRETFIKPNEEEEGKDILKTAHHNVPKKIDIASLNLGLTAKTETDEEPVPSPSSSPETVETTSSVLSGNTTLAPPPDSLTPNPVTSNVSSPTSQALEGPLLRPPPPPALAGGPPLPPPPAQGGMPLPPPPPPPGVGFTQSTPVEKPPRKPAVEPSCPMKPLYWTRIQIQDVNNDTLWSSLKEPPLLNASEFEDLFSKAALQTKRKPLSGTSEKKAKAKKLVKLLDGKRSQAVGILISSLHLEMKDIRQAVLTGDSSVVDLETIEALYESRALPEELERLKKHYETADKEHIAMLDKPEQFLYELSQIPDFSGRARCLIFQSVFTEGITSIKRKVENVLSVCEALLHRQSVRDIMGLVLVLGNYMNGGNRTRGQADGFGLEILPKLKDVKSRDNRISLVDFVVSYYLHNLDQMAGMDKSIFPLPEPQEVFLAAQVKFEDLNNDLRKLGRDLADCEKDVQTACSHSSEEHLHPFKEKMEAFVSNAQQDYSITNHHLRSAQKNFYELVDYFGMKPRAGEKQVVPSQVFMLWFEFCGDFKTRWKRESKSISKERLKEAQQSVRNITAEKKVETRTIHANGLKERLRQKEANMATS